MDWYYSGEVVSCTLYLVSYQVSNCLYTSIGTTILASWVHLLPSGAMVCLPRTGWTQGGPGQWPAWVAESPSTCFTPPSCRNMWDSWGLMHADLCPALVAGCKAFPAPGPQATVPLLWGRQLSWSANSPARAPQKGVDLQFQGGCTIDCADWCSRIDCGRQCLCILVFWILVLSGNIPQN